MDIAICERAADNSMGIDYYVVNTSHKFAIEFVWSM